MKNLKEKIEFIKKKKVERYLIFEGTNEEEFEIFVEYF